MTRTVQILVIGLASLLEPPPSAISEANSRLLLTPGVFSPQVDTRGHSEDRCYADLPFDAGDLKDALVGELARQKVPLEAASKSISSPRPLVLFLSLCTRGSSYSFSVTLQPGIMASDPSDVMYEEIWPWEMNTVPGPDLRSALLVETRRSAEEFARLYWQARLSR
jgi:hypothetical protein